MGFLPRIVKTYFVATTTTLTETNSFCELLNAIISANTNTITKLIELQNQNNNQDSYKVKIEEGDCEGFLPDKIISSDTISVEVVTEGNCKKLKLNVKDTGSGGSGSGGGVVTEPTCEKGLTTANIIYATFKTPNASLDQQWQGNIGYSINSLGEIKLYGKANIQNGLVIMSNNTVAQSPKFNSKSIFTPADDNCLKVLDGTSDFYGVNHVTNIASGSGIETTIAFSLSRIGRDFYVDWRTVKNTGYGSGNVNIQLSFGQLKSIN